MKFLIDPGHGYDPKGKGITAGKRSPINNGVVLYEGEFNRRLTKAILALAKEAGIVAESLVPEAWDVSLTERTNRANAKFAKDKNWVISSIHANANTGNWQPARGFEIFTSPGQTRSDEIATAIYDSIRATIEEWDMFVRRDLTDGDPDKEESFHILRESKCPAVLSEHGFMDNRQDWQLLMNDEFVRRLAEAHVAAYVELDKKYPNK